MRPGKLLAFSAGGVPAAERTIEELLAACARGEQSALGLVFDRLSPGVYRFVARLVGAGEAELDDLVQLTFLEVWRSAAAFRGASSAQSWIFGIAANVCRHFFRSEGRRRKMKEQLAANGLALVPTPETSTAQKELLGRLEHALAELPEHLSIPFIMVYIEELPGTEVAKVLQIPDGTLWRRLHQARQQIRQHLQEDSHDSRDMSVVSRAIARVFGRRRT